MGAAEQKSLYGNYPFHFLCGNAAVSTETVEAVLERSTSASSLMDDCGNYPLHFLCANTAATAEVVRLLIEKYPVAVAHKNGDGEFPLHICKKHSVPEEAMREVASALARGSAASE